MKSVRLRIAAKLVMVIGLIACVLGAAIYSILSLPEVLNIPFDWMYLAVLGIVAVVVIIVSMILLACSNTAALREELEARWLEEQAIAATVEPVEEAIDEAAEVTKKSLREKLSDPETVALAKKVGTIAVPALIACVATVAWTKSAQRKKQEKNRQAFYRWLG